MPENENRETNVLIESVCRQSPFYAKQPHELDKFRLVLLIKDQLCGEIDILVDYNYTLTTPGNRFLFIGTTTGHSLTVCPAETLWKPVCISVCLSLAFTHTLLSV